MRRSTPWQRCALLLCATVILIGCRAMETHDLDLSRYHNEERFFYANGKRADLNRRSYAYAWQSGDLAGECVTYPPGGVYGVSDTLDVPGVVLFDTDKWALTAASETTLNQVVERIRSYNGVRKVTIRGHTDDRASDAYNIELSRNRGFAIRDYLAARLPGRINYDVTELGESTPIAPGRSNEARRLNRRVEITVFAEGPSQDADARTLCSNEASARRFRTNAQAENAASLFANLLVLNDFRGAILLSNGDRLRLKVDDDAELNGIYEIGIGGTVELPYVGSVYVEGMNIDRAQQTIRDAFVKASIFQSSLVSINLAVQQLAPIDVNVQGAVFLPGRRTINGAKVETRVFKQTQNSGDFARDRLLSTALVASGGARPDADLANIIVYRGSDEVRVDLSGVVTGVQSHDFPLISGDRVLVPSIGYFQDALVRPTQVTVPGIRVFMSNQTIPTQSNALSAIGKDSTSLPYGTRFLRGLVSANCVGGTQYTNAARRAVLISTNPMTQRTEVIERSIQQLISDPDRDRINPLLMPNDGIACYDSEVSNIRDVARALSEVLTPLGLLKNLVTD